jgi:hypothetical protein
MSCNCNAKYDNKIPCCCSTGTTVVCTTTQCPNAQPCNTSVESDCVIYDKDHECIGITSGMTVTEVVDIILDKVNLIDCTTTIAPTCGCYLLINNTVGTLQYRYTPCGGSLSSSINLLSNQRVYICSSTIPINVTTGIKIGNINNLICTGTRANCSNPDSYCHTIEVTGTASFQYINTSGILTQVSITNSSVTICAWENSIDKLSGTGTYVIIPSDVECPLGTCD